jgi:hypothetical protein
MMRGQLGKPTQRFQHPLPLLTVYERQTPTVARSQALTKRNGRQLMLAAV